MKRTGKDERRPVMYLLKYSKHCQVLSKDPASLKALDFVSSQAAGEGEWVDQLCSEKVLQEVGQ